RLLLGVSLEVQPGQARDGHVHGELDRVVRPRDLLCALPLLRELGHASAQLVGVAEEAAEWILRGHRPRWYPGGAAGSERTVSATEEVRQPAEGSGHEDSGRAAAPACARRARRR